MADLAGSYWAWLLLALAAAAVIGFRIRAAGPRPPAVAEAAPVESRVEEATGRPAATEGGVDRDQPEPPADDRSSDPAPIPAGPETTGGDAVTPLAHAATGPAAALPAIDDEARHPGRRPPGLAAPHGGQADDLRRIRGIGPQNEARLHRLGIWHFAQIAAWDADNVKWASSYLAFPGRIDREGWVEQAKVLADGRDPGLARQARAGSPASTPAPTDPAGVPSRDAPGT